MVYACQASMWEKENTHTTQSLSNTHLCLKVPKFIEWVREREREREKDVSASECSSQNDHIQITKEMFSSMGAVHKLSRLFTLLVCLHGQHGQSYLA